MSQRACWPAQNNGQGLGFVLGGTVLDKRALKSAAVKLYGALSAAITFLAAANTPAAAEPTSASVGGDEPCALSATQRSVIRAAFGGANSTCSYTNVSLASILN